jgi:hypothetical protein
MLDPLWSTEAVELVHDAVESRRVDKVRAVSGSGAALRVLRVCLANTHRYKCGRCEKCLRTLVTLRLLGVEAPTFPPLDVGLVRKMPLHVEALSFLAENLDLAAERGDAEIAAALRAALRRYRLGQLLKEADELLLGSLLRRTRRFLKGSSRESALVNCVPERYEARRGAGR